MSTGANLRLAAAGCVFAALSSGCALTRMIQAIDPPPVKTPAPPTDNTGAARAQTGDPAAGGTMQVGFAQPATPTTLPMPQPQPAGTPTVPPPGTPAAAVPQGVATPPGAAAHNLNRPTITGAEMGLAPHEQPMEKATELIRKMNLLTEDNKSLLTRVRMLEAAAEAREQAVAESVREVETATGEVAKTRADMQAVRREINALKARVQQVEADEAETLRQVIAALEAVLRQPGGK